MGINLNIRLVQDDGLVLSDTELSKHDTIATLRMLGYKDAGEGTIIRDMHSDLAFQGLCCGEFKRPALPENFLTAIKELKTAITRNPDTEVTICWS